MSSVCPDLLVLTALAEDAGERELEPLRSHVAACESCRARIDLVRSERALLAAAVLVAPPEGSLERTLAAIDAASAGQGERPTGERKGGQGEGPAGERSTPSRSRPRPSRTPSSPREVRAARRWLPFFALSGAGLVILGAAFVVSQRGSEPEGRSEPEARPAETIEKPKPPEAPAPPAPEKPAPAPEAPRPDPPAPPAPTEDPDLAAKPKEEAAPEKTPDMPKEPDKPSPPEEPREVVQAPDRPKPPAPEPPSEAPKRPVDPPKAFLATVKSGKLTTASGSPLAPGGTIADGETADVGASPAVLECEHKASLVLAARSRFTVKTSAKGEPVFSLASGQALVRAFGETPWVVASAEARAVPAGTFIFSVAAGKTRVSAIEGKVKLELDRAGSPLDLDVRAGFEALVVKGKDLEAPLPFDAAKALASWLPEPLRPKKLPPLVRVVSSMSFDGLASGVKRGALARSGAHGSKGCLKAAPGEEGSTGVDLDLESAELVLAEKLSVEVSVKVDRRAKLEIVLEDDKGRTYRSAHEVEPGRWTTIAVPYPDFVAGPPPEHPGKKDDRPPKGPPPREERKLRAVSVSSRRAADPVELLVDDLRLLVED